MDQKPQNPIEVVFSRMVQAMDEWEREHTPEKMQKDVHALLNQSRDEIVRKLLGFNQSYGGKWELDHCNGRAGNSPAGEYLYNTLKPIINSWLGQVEMPTMTAQLRTKLESTMRQQFEDTLMRHAREAAQNEAHAVLKELRTELVKTDILAKFRATQQLIQPKE